MRRRRSKIATKKLVTKQSHFIYLLSCLMCFVFSSVFLQAQAQTSDQLLNAQITASAEIGANDLQASVIIVAGDSVFIDAGKVAGVEKSSYRGGQLTRRTSNGEELIGNFEVIEVGGEVSQIAVVTVFGKEVQMSDRAVFGAFSADVGQPGLQGMQQGMQARQPGKNGQNVFTNTFGNNPAGRAIGLATTGLAAPTNNAGLAQTSNIQAPNTQVTKSSVVPVGSAASLMAGFVATAAAKSAATGAPLYCNDARFSNREACQVPVPLMATSSVAPVTTPITATATTTATVTTTVTTSAAPEYCSSPTYQSRPECSGASVIANQNQALVGQRGYQPAQAQQNYQQVSATVALPGYCIDPRFSSRSECVVANVPAANLGTMTVSSAVPAYCSTPANQSRPECSAASTQPAMNNVQSNVQSNAQVNQRAYQAGQNTSHISTATAANQNAATGTALAIDPYTGKPYATSYQGHSDNAATPLVHTAAHSQATQTQATYSQVTQSTVGLATNSANPNTVINVPAHVGPATIANQTISGAANSSYATAQTYYDSDWGDNWDPTYVNTTPTASGIIPDGAPAPYFLRIARVKNNLGFPNEALEILQMGLGQYPNDVALQSEVTMIYRMLADGGTPDDWCAPEEIGIAPEPIATVDDCPDMESQVEPHMHDDGSDHHSPDHGHSHENDNHHSDYQDDHSHDDSYLDNHRHDDSHEDDHSHEDYDKDHDDNHDDDHTDNNNNSYANDHQENVQVSTRYNAPVNNRTNAAPEVNQSYAAQTQNKPTLSSPVGMANGYYSDEKGGIVRPLWNTDK